MSPEQQKIAELEKSLEDYRNLMNSSSDFVLSISKKGEIQFFTPQFTELSEYSSQELKELCFLSILEYPSQRLFREVMAKKGNHKDLYFTIVTKGGGARIINGSCDCREKDGIRYIRGIFRDVSELVHSRILLARNEAKFKLLFEKSLNPIVYYNNARGIIDCNDAFLKILGYKEKRDIIGRMPSEFSADEQPGVKDPIKLSWKIDNLALQNGGHQFEWMHKSRSGKEFLVSVAMSVVEIDGMQTFFAMWNDLSERYENERNLRETKQLVESKNIRLALLNDVNKVLLREDLEFDMKIEILLKTVSTYLKIDGVNISILNRKLASLANNSYTVKTDQVTRTIYNTNQVSEVETLMKLTHQEWLSPDEEEHLTHEVLFTDCTINSWLAIPIVDGRRLEGVLAVFSKNENFIDENIKEAMQDICTSISIFIRQRNLSKIKENNTHLANSISNIGTKILSFLNVTEINLNVYQEVNELIEAPIWGMGLFDSGKNALTFEGIIEYNELLPGFEFNLNDPHQLAVYCFENQQEILIGDLDEEIKNYIPDYDLSNPPGKRSKSVLYVPLTFQGKKLGVVSAQNYDAHKYTEESLFIIKSIAHYLAIAVNNARIYKDSESLVDTRTKEIIMQKIKIQKAKRLQDLITEVGKRITQAPDLETIFTELYHAVRQQMDATCFGIRIYNPSEQVLEHDYEIEDGTRLSVQSVSLNNKDNYSVLCLSENRSLFINNNAKEYRKYVSEIHVVEGKMTESLIFHPLYFQDQPVGVITVQSYFKNSYLPSHSEMIKSLTTFAALAIYNIKYRKEVSH